MNSRNQEDNKKLLKKLVKRSLQDQAKFRNRQLIRRILWAIGSLLIVFSLWLLAANLTPDTSTASCVELEEQIGEAQPYRLNPHRVVVQPWLGEHHVYALFAFPSKYSQAISLNLTDTFAKVKGVSQPIPATKANTKLYGSLETDNTFWIVSYLWTREALWLILQGKYGELANPCNWTLYVR